MLKSCKKCGLDPIRIFDGPTRLNRTNIQSYVYGIYNYNLCALHNSNVIGNGYHLDIRNRNGYADACNKGHVCPRSHEY